MLSTQPNVLRRAALHLTLTPWERAGIKLGESVLIAALVATLPVLITQVQTGHIDWMAVWPIFLAALLTALLKLLTAWNEPPLPGQVSAAPASQVDAPAN